MKELKPRLLLPQSSRQNGGNGPKLFLVFILAFVLGVYVGMKLNEWRIGEGQTAQVKDREIPDPPADAEAEDERLDQGFKADNEEDETVFLGENGSSTELVLASPSPSTAPVESNKVEMAELLEAGLEREKKDAKTEEYTVQIAAFKTMERAEIGANELKDKGYDAYIVPIRNSRAESWNLIRVGKFKTKEEAEDLAAMLRGMEGIGAVVRELD